MKTDFYIYEHWRPDTNVCFYVGRGRRRRAYRFEQRNEHHTRVVGKLHKQGLMVDVRIVIEGLTDEKADVAEIARIAFWRAVGVILTNQTNGGDGCAGRIASATHRQRLANALRGRPKSAEHRRNMSLAHTGKPHPLSVSPRPKGYKHRPETIEKIRQSNVGKTMSAASRAKMCASQQARQARARADSVTARQGLQRFAEEIDGRPPLIVEP